MIHWFKLCFHYLTRTLFQLESVTNARAKMPYYNQYNDNIMLAMYSNKKAMTLMLLHLSAEFNTVDHELLLECLSSRVGIQGLTSEANI